MTTREISCHSATEVAARDAEIRVCLNRMFQVLRAPQADEGDQRWLMQTYAQTLGKYGAAAVRAACEAALDGRIGNPRFRPTPAEMAVWCREEAIKAAERVTSAEGTRQMYLMQSRPVISRERRKELADIMRRTVREAC